MSARELLAQLEADDVRLTIEGDRLVLNAPKGWLSPARIEEIRPHKPELLAILSERRGQLASAEVPEKDSFDDIVEDARRFQREGKPGPWVAFTMSAAALDGAIGDLSPALRDDFELRIGIYSQDGHARKPGPPYRALPARQRARHPARRDMTEVSWSLPGLRAVATPPADRPDSHF